MTVQVLSSNLAYCVWFGPNAVQQQSVFEIGSLELVDERDRPPAADGDK